MVEKVKEGRISPAVIAPVGIAGLLLLGGIVYAATRAREEPEEYRTCPYCGLVFDTYDELRAHSLAEHPWEPMPEPPPGWEEEEPEFEPGRGPCPPEPVHVGGNWCMRTEASYTVYYEAHMAKSEHCEYYRTPEGGITMRLIDETNTHPDAVEAFMELWQERPERPGVTWWDCPYCTAGFSFYSTLRIHVLGVHLPEECGIKISEYYYEPGTLGYQAAIGKIKLIDAQYYKKMAEGTLEPCGGYYQCPVCGDFFNTYREYIDHQAEHQEEM